MAGTGVGLFSSTGSNNTSNLTVNFAENMAPSNVNNAARELMGHIRDMYEQLGDGYFEFGDGDGAYTVTRGDANTITITGTGDITAVYYVGRKIRITDGGGNVVEGVISASSHSSTTQTIDLTGISLASGTPTKVELGIDTAAFGGKVILDDDGDTYIEAPTDDTIDIYVAGAKDFVITANKFEVQGSSVIDMNGQELILDADADTSITASTDDQIDIEIAGADDFQFVANQFKVLSGSSLAFATNSIAYFGDGNNLQISSDGTNATIAESGGSGNLVLSGQTVRLTKSDGEIMLEGTNDAGVDIRHNNVKKLETTATGATVTGDLTASGGSFLLNATNFLQLANDDFSRVVIADTEIMRVTSNAKVGINETAPLGVLHVKSGDSGASVNAVADELVIEASGNGGMTILNGTTSTGVIHFGDSGDNDNGFIAYGHSDRNMDFAVNGNTNFGIRIAADNSLASNGEAAPDVSAGGICLQQAGNDTKILSMKSSDIAHGFTATSETDSYGTFGKSSGSDGGLAIHGFHEGQGFGIQLKAHCKTAGYTASNTAGYGHLDFLALGSDGSTGNTALEVDENIMSVRNGGDVKFIVKGDGDLFADGTLSAYDTYEDAQLVRAFDLSHGKNVINSTFDKYVKYNHETLANANLVGREEDGTPNHFINVTGMQRLHNGAIWQQYEKTERLANAMYELAKAAVGEDKANEILEQNEIKLLN